MSDSLKILIYGYGNPGRQDDGLGKAVCENLEKENYSNVTIDINYQLNAEDAFTMSEHDVVIFVDASEEKDLETFKFVPLTPDKEVAFTTHAMSAGSVLALSDELYKKKPPTYMLGIKGFEWGFKEELSKTHITLESYN